MRWRHFIGLDTLSMGLKSRSSIPRGPARDAERKALRARLLASRQRLPDEWRRTADVSIAQRLLVLLKAAAPAVVGVYWAVRAEPDPGPMLEQLASDGTTLALPVVDGPSRPLRFVAWQPGDPTVVGAYGIPRPVADTAVTPHALVIPCVGFDARCYRLGYGGGFYDRTLATFAGSAARRPLAFGVAYDEAEVPDVDPDEHDVMLDAVVTPTRVLTSGGAPGGWTR
jgi:5-formyltetrahydrofolate cyclo-ligase